jgi:hypothetical protein
MACWTAGPSSPSSLRLSLSLSFTLLPPSPEIQTIIFLFDSAEVNADRPAAPRPDSQIFEARQNFQMRDPWNNYFVHRPIECMFAPRYQVVVECMITRFYG